MWCCKSNAVIIQQKETPAALNDDTDSVQEENSFGAFFVEKTDPPSVSHFNISGSSAFTPPSSANKFDKEEPKASVNTFEKEEPKERYLITYVSDDDDGISTVYSEDTPMPFVTRDPIDPAAFNRYHRSPKDDSTILEVVSLSLNSYVMLPDVHQRGYEPFGQISYSNAKMVRTKPYEVGTLIWFRYESPSLKFKWYIPGKIRGYIFERLEVKGYDVHVECDLGQLENGNVTKILKNAPPEHTMLRWDEETPPCPVNGIDVSAKADNFESSECRVEKAIKQYGPDLGFQGAKQNGLG